MNSFKRLLFIVCALVFILSQSWALASKSEEMLDDATKIVAKGDRAKSTSDKDEYYKEAVKKYGIIMKQYRKTIAGVEAKYATAMVYEKYIGEKNHLQKSHDFFKQLENMYYGMSDAKLEENFSKEEIVRLKQIIEDCNEKRVTVAIKMDKKNRDNILYRVMDLFVKVTGSRPGFSYWFAIILVTVFVKIMITPLTKAQFKTMKQMQEISPLIKKIQEKYKGDQQAIGEKTMELYKKHSINPFSGCLPILVQMPILYVLYYMIKMYEFQFEQGTFLWIGSAFSHVSSFLAPMMEGTRVWFTAANLSEPDLILVILYLISMYVSTKMSAVDPSQADQQNMMAVMMPIMFAFIFIGFPAAFLLYWLVFNILNTVQQYLIVNSGKKLQPQTIEAEVKNEKK